LIKKIDITNLKFAKEVLSVQLPSYQVEAELIDFYDIPPLKDTVSTPKSEDTSHSVPRFSS